MLYKLEGRERHLGDIRRDMARLKLMEEALTTGRDSVYNQWFRYGQLQTFAHENGFLSSAAYLWRGLGAFDGHWKTKVGITRKSQRIYVGQIANPLLLKEDREGLTALEQVPGTGRRCVQLLQRMLDYYGVPPGSVPVGWKMPRVQETKALRKRA